MVYHWQMLEAGQQHPRLVRLLLPAGLEPRPVLSFVGGSARTPSSSAGAELSRYLSKVIVSSSKACPLPPPSLQGLLLFYEQAGKTQSRF